MRRFLLLLAHGTTQFFTLNFCCGNQSPCSKTDPLPSSSLHHYIDREMYGYMHDSNPITSLGFVPACSNVNAMHVASSY